MVPGLRGLGYPSVIVTPCPREAAYHETYFDDTAAPDNVRVVHDEGSCNSWLQWMAGSSGTHPACRLRR